MEHARLAIDATKFSKIVEIRDLLLTKANPMRLESGQPDFDTPEHIKQAAIDAMLAGKTGYAPSAGVAELKRAMVSKAKERNGFTVDEDHVIAVQGGMHGLFVAARAIVPRGGRVLLANPNWGATKNVLLANELEPVFVDMSYDPEAGFSIKPSDFERAVEAHQPSAFILNNPHNPTGAVIPDEDVAAIVEICARHGVHLIADEAYEDIYYTPDKPKCAAHLNEAGGFGAEVTSVFTFSKSYSMTGWRLGTVTTTEDQTMERLKKLVLYSANGINTFVQIAGAAALSGPQECTQTFRDGYRKRRDLLVEGVRQSRILSCAEPRGAFYLHAKIESGESSEELSRRLVEEHELGSVPGGFFNAKGEDGFIRFAYCCSEEMVSRAAELLSGL